MKSLYKILADVNTQSKRYFDNILFYAQRIKNLIKQALPDARLLIFGSVIRNDFKPGSDIDILVISSQIPKGLFAQAEIKLKIKDEFPDAPFEIHLITPEEYENWYKKFIKDGFKEI